MFRGFSRISLLYFSKSKNVSVTPRQNPVFDLLQSRFSDSGGLKVRAVSAVNIRYMSTPVSSSSVATTDTATQPVELLAAVNDHYDGVMVDMKEPVDPQVFASSLDASISHWRLQGKKGVWIKLPTKLVNLVEAAVKKGFWYHHAESDYLMLVYWIPETVHTIPASASHRVGVGAFVINDKKEVLVVQEKNGRFKGTGLWKFPTGVVDEGEDICVAAAREVKEETGIDAEFVEVLGFRQSHKAFFGKSDLFFLCMLRPLSFTIKKQEKEIEAAEWMPIEEYAAQPFVQNHGLLKYMIDVGLAAANREYSGFSPVPTDSMFAKDKSFLYLNCKDLSKLKNSGNQP